MIVKDPGSRPASDAQISFLHALLDDGLDNLLIDDEFVSLRIGRKPQGANDFTMTEAGALISELKELGCEAYKDQEDY